MMAPLRIFHAQRCCNSEQIRALWLSNVQEEHSCSQRMVSHQLNNKPRKLSLSGSLLDSGISTNSLWSQCGSGGGDSRHRVVEKQSPPPGKHFWSEPFSITLPIPYADACVPQQPQLSKKTAPSSFLSYSEIFPHWLMPNTSFRKVPATSIIHFLPLCTST